MIEQITAPLFDQHKVAHGFFGRIGGVSPAPFAGLNVSTSVGDSAENVNANIALIEKSLGLAPDHLCLLKQTHSVDVISVSSPLDRTNRIEADGMVSATKGLGLGILTADCGPVLFADTKNQIIGACHAGWKGAVGGIVGNVIVAMVKLGAERQHIIAALGPSIHVENYEVGAQFQTDVAQKFPQTEAFFEIPAGASAPHFNLPKCIAAQLESANIADFFISAHCTYAAPQNFFSHRYATHQNIKTGRQLSAIAFI